MVLDSQVIYERALALRSAADDDIDETDDAEVDEDLEEGDDLADEDSDEEA